MENNFKTNYLELLRYAIMNDDKPKILQLLLQDNTDLEAINENGDTIIHFVVDHASAFSEIEIIKILHAFITRGVDMKVKNSAQETVLHLAIDKQLEHVANFLMKHIADVDTVDDEGDSIVHYYVKKLSKDEAYSLQFVDSLLSNGFSFDEKNKNGQSPLHLAIEYNLQHILPTLLKHTNDINFVSEKGQQTLLQLFLSASHEKNRNFCGLLKCAAGDFPRQLSSEIVTILLERGVSVDHEDSNGLTALHLAIRLEEQAIVKILIDRITKVTGKCGIKLVNEVIEKATWGYLHEGYYLKILLDLTAKGADVNLEDDQGKSPWYHAIKLKNLAVVNFMTENCSVNYRVKMKNGNGLLHALAEENRGSPAFQKALFYKLARERCEVNAKNNRGKTPLHVATDNYNIPIVQELIAHEADVDCRDFEEGLSPLHIAARRGSINIMELLLNNGAKINGRDRSGKTPLLAAATICRKDISQMLLQRGAEVNARDRQGDTALAKALCRNCDVVIEVLLMYGADVNDLSVIRAMSQCKMRWAAQVLWRHHTKLKAARLPYLESHDLFTKNKTYQQLYDDCSREIEALKSTPIDSHKTLYDWLHMEPNRRYIYKDELQRIADCPKMEKKFPHYFSVILNVHRETLRRKALLESAKEVWQELTEIHLPNICLERILAYVDTGDLFAMTEMLSEVFN